MDDDNVFGSSNNNEIKNLFSSGNDKENTKEQNNINDIFSNNSKKQSENKIKPTKINTNIIEKKTKQNKIIGKKEKHVKNNSLNEFLSKEEENIDDIFGPRNNNGEGLFG